MVRICVRPGRKRIAACAFFLALSATSAAHAGGVYFVKEGDTLSSVSRLFGVTAARLRAENALASTDLHPGDRLHIPDAPAPAVVATPVPVPEASVELATIAPARLRDALCREERVYHTVAKGDTLAAIARRYDTELDDLFKLNGLRKTSRLSIGQKVVVRRSGPRTHTVRRGETLARVAARYRITAADLAALNRLPDTKLAVGQRLLLESCDPVAAAGTAPPSLAPARASAAAPAAPAALAGGAPVATGAASRVIDLAKTMLDIPYRFGGTTLRGIDCSAYVQKVFGLLDIDLPRTAREQFTVGARIGQDELSVGDLVFFRTYASFPSHVGIYLGDNLFIHASSVVRKVTIDSLDQGYYRKRFLGGRRLVDDDTRAVASAP
jgi:cell wall-associated NlpC family hydrolase